VPVDVLGGETCKVCFICSKSAFALSRSSIYTFIAFSLTFSHIAASSAASSFVFANSAFVFFNSAFVFPISAAWSLARRTASCCGSVFVPVDILGGGSVFVNWVLFGGGLGGSVSSPLVTISGRVSEVCLDTGGVGSISENCLVKGVVGIAAKRASTKGLETCGDSKGASAGGPG